MTINDLSPDRHIDVTTFQICNGHILIDTPGVTFDLNEQIIAYNPFLSTSAAPPHTEYPRVPKSAPEYPHNTNLPCTH